MTQRPVDSTYLPCCNAIGQHAAGCSESLSERMRRAADELNVQRDEWTRHEVAAVTNEMLDRINALRDIDALHDVPLPPGAAFGDVWEGQPPQRVVMGQNRAVTDADVIVWTSAIQHLDGTLEKTNGDGREPPTAHIDGGPMDLNSDQCRELAAALLEAAAEIDGWAK